MIVLASTPLGNARDASQRLISLLAEADVVAAEDTRRVRRLARDLGVEIRGRVVSFYEAVESARSEHLLDVALAADALVLVVSDAGTPVVSDPGYRLVARAAQRGVRVSVAPGPSAVTAALAVSGLPSDRFCFEGFLPRKQGERARRLAALRDESRTMVFFESPRRTADALSAMADAFGTDRAAVLCRELTKTHEEVVRGSLAELRDATQAAPVLGEVTLVVAGAPARSRAARVTPESLAEAVALREAAGEHRKSAIASVAREYEVPKRDVFDAVVAARNTSAGGPA